MRFLYLVVIKQHMYQRKCERCGFSCSGFCGSKQITALQKPAVANAAYAALADPKAEHVELASVDGKGTARVVRLPDGTGYLVPANLPKLPAGRVYQLWAVRSDAKISLGVLGAAPEVTAFRMNGPVAAYAVTDEAAGGVAQSQNQPVVVGYVKA